MELRHLRYFVAVAEELHFRRAAERLHVSQPPLSQQIRRLESELGVTLFERNRRRVELTAAGTALLGEARRILAAVDQAADLARRTARGDAGALSVGFVGSAMDGRLPEVLREFHAARPAVQLRLRELSTGEALAALADGRVDAGVVRPGRSPVDPELQVEVVSSEPVLAALPAGHRLARTARVSLAELGGEAFVLLAAREAPGLHGALAAAMAQEDVAPAEVQEVTELRTVLGLVSAGVGVSLVPATTARGERAGVVFRPLAGRPPTVELALVWRAGDASPVLAAFLAIARTGLRAGARSP